MTRTSHFTRLLLGIIVAVCVLTAGPVAQPAITVVMSGLDNPRGLAFGPEGALYVVEAGRGGTEPCMMLRGRLRCYGATGAITRLWRGAQERIAIGLPSYADLAGEGVTGPHDISFLGRGGAFMTIGFSGNPALRSGFGNSGALFGTLVHVAASGQWNVVADIAAHESATNPDGSVVDSNPYGMLAEPGTRIVADAGANSLFEVSANGDVSTLAVFPARPLRSTDAVPTAVVVGPDGAYYVSELTGTHFRRCSSHLSGCARRGADGVSLRIQDGDRSRFRARRQPLRAPARHRCRVRRTGPGDPDHARRERVQSSSAGSRVPPVWLQARTEPSTSRITAFPLGPVRY